MSKTLIGNEITTDLHDRLRRLEEILLCSHCKGSGDIDHKWMGVILCPSCNGTGNRLDGLEDRG